MEGWEEFFESQKIGSEFIIASRVVFDTMVSIRTVKVQTRAKAGQGEFDERVEE
jgi:hypothetical protein